eukprot:5554068-Amphidinium_carterae.2
MRATSGNICSCSDFCPRSYSAFPHQVIIIGSCVVLLTACPWCRCLRAAAQGLAVALASALSAAHGWRPQVKRPDMEIR